MPLFTMVVPVEALDILLVLLTFRTSSGSCAACAPRFVVAPGPFAVPVELEALRPVPAFGRPAFGFSPTILARLAVAAAAAAFAGDATLTGEIGFRGDAGRDM